MIEINNKKNKYCESKSTSDLCNLLYKWFNCFL